VVFSNKVLFYSMKRVLAEPPLIRRTIGVPLVDQQRRCIFVYTNEYGMIFFVSDKRNNSQKKQYKSIHRGAVLSFISVISLKKSESTISNLSPEIGN
jgi:hypothetical protein